MTQLALASKYTLNPNMNHSSSCDEYINERMKSCRSVAQGHK